MQSETWIPRSDVYENSEAWLIIADVPGATPESVSLIFEASQLKLEAGGGGYRFVRSWRLPRDVESDQVKAELKNGVLNIQIPKAATARHRKISVAEG